MYSVDFYDLGEGKDPVLEFLESLDIKAQAKIDRNIQLLKARGPQLGMPFTRHLQDGIFELRTQSGNDIFRILFYFRKTKMILLTNGFTKYTQKTPRNEIEKAKKYRADYERRHLND